MDDLKKSFYKKFVEPEDKDLRAICTCGEPHVIGSAKDMLTFIRQREKELLDEIEGYFVEEMGVTPPSINTVYNKFLKIYKGRNKVG
ncbi:MAG TPA: hypothetical protein ENI23_09485 [bacterium]|nr:hypothetical protein [bacterium]